MDDSKKLINATKAAEIYGVDPRFFRDLMRSGEIHYRKPGREYLTTETDIDNWYRKANKESVPVIEDNRPPSSNGVSFGSKWR
jgi:hypothetical protein